MSEAGLYGTATGDNAITHVNLSLPLDNLPPVASVPQTNLHFALMLVLAGHDILDYTSAAGAKTFEAAIRHLNEIHYDCTSRGYETSLKTR